MPRLASGKPTGAVSARSVVRGRSAGKTRERRRADCGPRISTDVAQLESLRRRCAASENLSTLERVSYAARELRWVASESLHAELDALVDRIGAKIERLTATRPKRSHAAQHLNGATAGMTIRMAATAWATDDLGNRSRTIWNSADGLSPPTPVPPP
jgi:hypothetical protein